MDEKILTWLHDILRAATYIQDFVENKSISDYSNDILISSAVERQFEIIGEALRRIRDEDEVFIKSIEGWRGAISFRNILAHGYDEIEDELVFSIIEDDLPILIRDINKYL